MIQDLSWSHSVSPTSEKLCEKGGFRSVASNPTSNCGGSFPGRGSTQGGSNSLILSPEKASLDSLRTGSSCESSKGTEATCVSSPLGRINPSASLLLLLWVRKGIFSSTVNVASGEGTTEWRRLIGLIKDSS
ncbi:uncharacterized protein A4U43_C09F8180 [Asparagus officinalis]|uniref:Uncharacterized protein n=1 Tax=Asparagus officinalis TaxID=4686 RepID=A0A5P1EB00_ASPOF|nr:uncharacterized protein A4U43_C09F8180 [Asparagus officinalis]